MYNLNTMQRAIALSTVGLALTASPALAQPDYPTTHVTQSPAGAASGSLDLRSPDAVDASRDQAPEPSAPTDLRSPDAADAGSVTSSLAGTTSASPEVIAADTTATDDGLDWGSIAIGAGAILAVSLIGLGGVAMTHRGRVRTAR
jgi:hypothetical protein